MYEEGELIIYGTHSVCRIESVGALNIGGSNDQVYYTLNPIYQDGKIYTPVNTAVYMRKLITLEKVHHLISNQSNIADVIEKYETPKEFANYYKDCINEYDCEELLTLIKTITSKQKLLLDKGGKLGQVEERYKKEARNLLYQEFAMVLQIDKNDVQGYMKEYTPKAS